MTTPPDRGADQRRRILTPQERWRAEQDYKAAQDAAAWGPHMFTEYDERFEKDRSR